MSPWKSIFDFVLSFVAIIILIPFFIIVSSLLIISYKSFNILFIQDRIGKNLKLFKIIKFRTMIIHQSNNTISVKGDSRITPIGKYLRKYKIDELPELFNIVTGNMSFVGPRPDVPGYIDKLKGEDRIILKLRPGLTGLASLKYINEEEILASVSDPKWYNDNVIFPDKVRINKLYYKNWTFWLDLKIIYHTLLRKPYKEDNYFKS